MKKLSRRREVDKMNENTEVKDAFEKYFLEWSELIRTTPEIMLSSHPFDYIRNEPYEKIIKMGKPALPFIMEKLHLGEFHLNYAVFEITGLDLSDVIPDPEEFYSEQEISDFLLTWWDQYQQKK